MKYAPQSARRREGFTLIEVLIVVAIIGIAAAVMVPAMLRGGMLSIQAASRLVISDLIYAQNEAIAQQAVRRVVFDAVLNQYQMTDATGQVLSLPWRGGFVENFNSDGRFTGVALDKVNFNGTLMVEFDPLGTPTNGGSVDLTSPNLRYRVSVAPVTGRITITQVTP